MARTLKKPKKMKSTAVGLPITVSGRRCLDEFNFFMGAGLPGFDRLQAVYTSIFKEFGVQSKRERTEILLQAGLKATGPKTLQPVRATSGGWWSSHQHDDEL